MRDVDLNSVPHPAISFFFFFNDTATTEIYTLSLHDALPISRFNCIEMLLQLIERKIFINVLPHSKCRLEVERNFRDYAKSAERSEEHTSELQSPCNLVCRLLLEKKK